MLIGHVSGSRLYYYDRTPVVRTLESRTFGLPPMNFIDVSYTVPTNKKAYIQNARAKIMRETAAGVLGIRSSMVDLTPNGGSLMTVAEALLKDNTIGRIDSDDVSAAGLLGAGDHIATETQTNGETGGTITFIASVWAVEFTA